MQANGRITKIDTNKVNTKFGEKDKTNYTLDDGKIYSKWGKNQDNIFVGTEVLFDFEVNNEYNNIKSKDLFVVQKDKLPIQQVSKPVETIQPTVEKDLLKQIVAKIAQLESQVNKLITLCDQYNERISLLADTNKTLNDRVRRLEDINRDIEAIKTGN